MPTHGKPMQSSSMNLSTNEILFDCQRDLLLNAPISTIQVRKFVKDYHTYNGNEGDAQQNFSHDNFTGVFCWFAVFDRQNIKYLPALGHHALHPLRWIFFQRMKREWFVPLLPLLYLDIALECNKATYVTNHGNVEVPTSTKLLHYFMVRYGLKDEMFFNKVMRPRVNASIGGYPNTFEIYFPKGHRVLEAYKYRKLV